MYFRARLAVVLSVASFVPVGCGSGGENSGSGPGGSQNQGSGGSDGTGGTVDAGTGGTVDAGTGGADTDPGDEAGVDASQDAGDEAGDTSSSLDEGIADSGLFGIAPDTDIQTVTEAQQGQLCDWYNEKLGGYGQSYTCGGGSVHNYENQGECVRSVFTGACVLTLEQFETCILAQAPSHGCNTEYVKCYALYQCYVFE